MTDQKSLIDLDKGKQGRIIKINGGQGLCARMNNMGIYPGTVIKKISQQAMRGPLIVKVGTTQVGIGYGMATKIIVEEI